MNACIMYTFEIICVTILTLFFAVINCAGFHVIELVEEENFTALYQDCHI